MYFQKIKMNSFVIRNPISPHPGKVIRQVSTISFATPQLTDRNLFAAPTPMIAVVFACVVETGIPVSEHTRSPAVAEISAANP